jgi:ABC-2 type transport system ATP-binding protein
VAPVIVETRGLSKRYGNGTLAVDRLDLEVRRGEVYGFLGANGAGKTTTMRMLVGLIAPTSGTASVVGRAPGSREGLARIGCLIESPGFYPFLSGRDNLRVVARSCSIPDSRVEEALEQVDLRPRAGDRFGAYSLGMKQRLGVAASLLKDPDLLILDEPTNGLDPQGMVEMRDMIRNLAQGERTVLLSSHLLNEVEHVCQRVGVIQGGRLIAEGTLDELRGSASLYVRAEPQDLARDKLLDMVGAGALTEEADGLFRLAVATSRSGEINSAMVNAGITVTELRPFERSLEETFLQLTHEQAAEAAEAPAPTPVEEGQA